MRQYTEWGYLDWEYLPEKGNPNRWMSVAITNILPGKTQSFHVHYGHEQLLYVLEGSGKTQFNGVEYSFKPGDYFTLESDTTHYFTNQSDVVVRELLISNPIPIEFKENYKDEQAFSSEDLDNSEKHINMLYIACESMKQRLLENVSMPFCILDSNSQVVIKNDVYPQICTSNCDPVYNPLMCNCYMKPFDSCSKDQMNYYYICPYNMEVFIVPIIYEGHILGTIRGGHFFTSKHNNNINLTGQDPHYDIPHSAELSYVITLHRLADSIEDYLKLLSSMKKFDDQKRVLKEAAELNQTLTKDLFEIEEQVTNLKINHHFLFNTLNSLATMSLVGDREDLYTNIINLSKMFRYTMTIGVHRVTLRKELEYLQTYLSLQKLRYKDGLNLDYRIDDGCLGISVPFNFLQPVVENAFTHGFMSYDYDKHVSIIIEPKGNQVLIRIENNGIVMLKEKLERANRSLSSGSGHGLSLIYDKLNYCYGNQFSMEVTSGDGITAVSIILPR